MGLGEGGEGDGWWERRVGSKEGGGKMEYGDSHLKKAG